MVALIVAACSFNALCRGPSFGFDEPNASERSLHMTELVLAVFDAASAAGAPMLHVASARPGAA